MDKVKRYSLLEVALLGMFVIGLLLAAMLINIRTAITMTDPIDLPGAGLSVTLPAGSGWQFTPQWQPEADNSMALLAQQIIRRNVEIELRWRYTLYARQQPLMEVLAERIAANTMVQPLGTMGNLGMEFAQVYNPAERGQSFYIGIVQLDHGRTLELQIRANQRFEDPDYIRKVLSNLASAIVYQKPAEMDNGQMLLSDFFQTVQFQKNTEAAFVIKAPWPAGYFHLQNRYSNENQARRRHIQSRHFETRQFLIQSDLRLERESFAWKTEITLPAGQPRTYEIAADEHGSLLVTSNIEKPKTLHIQSRPLPELLLGELAAFFHTGPYEQVIIDVLSPTGQVLPARLSMLALEQAKAQSPEVAAVVRVDYLHKQDAFEELFFGPQGNLIGRYEQQSARRARVWDAATPGELRTLFGDDFPSVRSTVALGD